MVEREYLQFYCIIPHICIPEFYKESYEEKKCIDCSSAKNTFGSVTKIKS